MGKNPMIVLWLEILLPRHLSLSPLSFLRGLTISSLVTFSLSYILIKLHCSETDC